MTEDVFRAMTDRLAQESQAAVERWLIKYAQEIVDCDVNDIVFNALGVEAQLDGLPMSGHAAAAQLQVRLRLLLLAALKMYNHLTQTGAIDQL